LGLHLLFRHVNTEEREDFAFFELDGGNLELIQRLDEPFEKPPLKPSLCPHLAFTTDDMSQTLRMFEEKHVQIVKGPLEIAGAERWVYIADPDNNVIEYIQWLSK
jgi:catechol 2,3-dioxygenase-like lactoylglutathione lyase family enzyme